MGNGFSKVNLEIENYNDADKISEFLDSIDTEVCEQILSINSDDIVNLIKEKYCNQLINIINHLLISKFNNKEIFYIYKRVQSGYYIQETDSFMTENINDTDIKHHCRIISKFFVKICHLYAVILSTLNPTFTYTDYRGKIQTGNLEDKDNANTDISLKETAICSKRISSLLLDINLLGIDNCNADSINDSLTIPELKPLYADIYNLEIKGYQELTEEAQELYNNDLSTFYRSFTGKHEMPSNITTFCDIKLNDRINKDAVIISKINLKDMFMTNHSTNSLGSQLFSNFAVHLANILKYAEEQKKDILAVVNRLFHVKDDSNIIHPRLTDEKLKSLVTQSRKLIVNIHITCDKDAVISINMLEAIIELVRLKTQVRRIKNLEQDIENLIK